MALQHMNNAKCQASEGDAQAHAARTQHVYACWHNMELVTNSSQLRKLWQDSWRRLSTTPACSCGTVKHSLSCTGMLAGESMAGLAAYRKMWAIRKGGKPRPSSQPS